MAKKTHMLSTASYIRFRKWSNCLATPIRHSSDVKRMSELIPIDVQLSAVILAEESSFLAAAERLGVSPRTLHDQINELVTRLECSLFRGEGDGVEVTEDGRVLIDAFRTFLAQRGKLLK